jgi:pheromone shutdown protein TraB
VSLGAGRVSVFSGVTISVGTAPVLSVTTGLGISVITSVRGGVIGVSVASGVVSCAITPNTKKARHIARKEYFIIILNNPLEWVLLFYSWTF